MTDDELLAIRLIGSTPACDVPLDEWKVGDLVWHPDIGCGSIEDIYRFGYADRVSSMAVLWNGHAIAQYLSPSATLIRRLPNLVEEPQ